MILGEVKLSTDKDSSGQETLFISKILFFRPLVASQVTVPSQLFLDFQLSQADLPLVS